MKKTYAKRVELLQESTTIAISSLARELKAAGQDILSFSAGEPDFDTPEIIKDEAIRALKSGFTKYTAVAGIPDLLDAIKGKLLRENNLSYESSEILVSNGAKHSLFNAFQALVDSDDEVIIPSPYWVTYPELVTFSGGKSIIVQTTQSNDFKITPKQLSKAITSKTKIFVLNTPSNPTGMVYTKEELEGLAEVLKDTDIWVISDEMYEKLVYGVKFVSVAAINDDMMQRTITINGLSKSVAMTGWRIGYLACKDKKLVKLMNNLQSQCTSNINSITQKASILPLKGEADNDIEEMRKAFEERMNFACDAINNIQNLSVNKPQGAFYLFVNISALPQYGADSMAFCQALLKEQGVALVPGVAFGMEGFVRLSFACSLEQLKEGIGRISQFVKTLLK
ncbi:pyridoxal phosphate-dependent aminotransferase [Helicobacter japonicus]|uniref:Aminotransferase n=5 Tax=Helicobacter japonicus TaxID=425400 RepID=A0A4V6I414_9HELI|nr:pyridoxal phosphate-dependent aminotransferase [Helicobacter japonicus]TLE02073.1 pyridoxal phosphate-dependent aminotransferase [Helicobacter japonicus]